MPSQYDYLVDKELRKGLRRHATKAEHNLARLYNRRRRPENRLVVPAPDHKYDRYDIRLLALLWAVAQNASALLVLARHHGWTAAEAPDYDAMPNELLAFLWRWGRDAQALQMLWTERGWLPAGAVDGDSLDAVLGFLWWRYRLPEARDELFRRYHFGGRSDKAQDRALTLLLVVDRWDYERYPTLGGLLNVSAARHAIDIGHHDARAPRANQDEAEAAPVADWDHPQTSLVEREYLQREVPLEVLCLHKLRENSTDQPLDLSEEEQDYLARKNLEYRQAEDMSGPALARERKQIVQWMAENPEPSESKIRERFPWFRQSTLARQTRQWLLQWRAAQNNQLLTPLLTGGDETLIDLACTVQDNMDELIRRVETAGRNAPLAERGPVLLYAELVEAAERLRHLFEERRLHNGRSANVGAWQLNLQAFLDRFPILMKLTACRRLAYWLLHSGFPPHEMPTLETLCDWLDKGPWLATFSEEERLHSDAHCCSLTELRGAFRDVPLLAIDLLIRWLQSTQESGAPPRPLLQADREWWHRHALPTPTPDPLPAPL